MKPLKKVLIVDDHEGHRELVSNFITKMFPDAIITEINPINESDSNHLFHNNEYDLLILDYELGNKETGVDWFKKYSNPTKPFPATVMLTGKGSESIVVEVLKCGINEYLPKKNLTFELLSNSIKSAIESQKIENKKKRASSEHSAIFSKEIFFSTLNLVIKNNLEPYFLIIVHQKSEKINNKLIAAGNILRHISRQIYHYFSSIGGEDIHVIPYSEDYILILMKHDKSEEKLIHILKETITFMDKHPFIEDGIQTNTSVSIGAIPLKNNTVSVSTYIDEVVQACQQAKEKKDRVKFINFRSGLIENVISIHGANLSTSDFDIKQAFLENRAELYFQTILPVTDSAKAYVPDIHDVRIRLIEFEGNILEPNIASKIINQENINLIVDKWVIKEVFVRILRFLKAVKQSPLFFIRFSEKSITDPKLMDWLVQLLEVQLLPQNTLALEIKADDYLAHKKKIVPLIKYLRDTHNLSFLLSNVKGQETLKECCSRSYFEYVKLDPSCIEKLTKNSSSLTQVTELIDAIREQKSLSIIPMIESAAILSTSIQCDPDLLQGYFIDMPQSEIVHTNTIQLEESEGTFN